MRRAIRRSGVAAAAVGLLLSGCAKGVGDTAQTSASFASSAALSGTLSIIGFGGDD